MDQERFRQVESLFWEMIHSDDQQLEAIATAPGGEQKMLHQTVVALIIKDRELEGSHFLQPAAECAKRNEQNATSGATCSNR